MIILLLAIAWIVYLALHSVLASASVKRLIPISPRTYRLWYAVISTLGLIGLFWMVSIIPAPNFFNSVGWLRFVSLMLTTFGVMTVQLSFRYYPIRPFLGLADEGSSKLRTEGLLSVVRHPIYSGTILITIGFFLFIPNLPTLISCLCIWAYLPVGIYLEEQKLIALYGDEYQRYRERVPAIIPHVPGMK